MENKELLFEMLKAINGIREDMREDKKEILQVVYDLKDEVKENKKEIQKSREIEEAHWQENLRRWDENDKKWEENNRRWDENDKKWEENNRRWEENDKKWEENTKMWQENAKMWQEYRENRKKDRTEILRIFTNYDISISRQLGDKNAEKMVNVV